MDRTLVIADELFQELMSPSDLAAISSLSEPVYIKDHEAEVWFDQASSKGLDVVLVANPDFFEWDLNSAWLANLSAVSTLISTSDNLSWIDHSTCERQGIKVFGLTELVSEYESVGEYATTLMMNLLRRMPLLAKGEFPCDYGKDFISYQGELASGKTAGIIGLGNIGGEIARRCKALGMNVSYWSRSSRNDAYEYGSIEEVVGKCDVLFPTLVPEPETSQMLTNDILSLLKPSAHVVSVVHGLIDTNYLAERVADETLGGLAFGADPGTFNSFHGNVWASPDYAWATKENMDASYSQLAETIKQTLS